MEEARYKSSEGFTYVSLTDTGESRNRVRRKGTVGDGRVGSHCRYATPLRLRAGGVIGTGIDGDRRSVGIASNNGGRQERLWTTCKTRLGLLQFPRFRFT